MPEAIQHFQNARIAGRSLDDHLQPQTERHKFKEFLEVMELVHIEHGLLQPYGLHYPLVEARELIPSFDAPLIEYKQLPAFSMVIFDRQLSYQDEGFQYDMLQFEGDPPDPGVAAQNRQLLRDRLPRNLLPKMDSIIGRKGVTSLERYAEAAPLMMSMDRGQVLSRDRTGGFRLAGTFASFPSDLDGEIKQFGRRIGKFSPGDNSLYAENRGFVYQFLMEQTGFPICGERHTSAALFARRLMRRRERFAIHVLGASDRTLTVLSSRGGRGGLPGVRKYALASAADCSDDAREELARGGYYVDPDRQVVILKVDYMRHSYHRNNVLEDRALSITGQSVIHPETGEVLKGVDILNLGQQKLLLLNDIVRGEFRGSVVYKGRETMEFSEDTRSRLMFLVAWLRKHRHIFADYSPENFDRVVKVVNSYLDDSSLWAEFARYNEEYQEVKAAISQLRVAHRLRLVEKLVKNRRDAAGRKLLHVQLLVILVHFINEEAHTLHEKYPGALRKLISICRKYLQNSYLKKRYLSGEPKTLMDFQVRAEYTRLAGMVAEYDALINPPKA